MTASADDVIEVPSDALQPDTLRRVIEEFVTRSGTDYGDVEKSLEQKVREVMRQLQRREAKLMYDQRDGTVNIVVAARKEGTTRDDC